MWSTTQRFQDAGGGRTGAGAPEVAGTGGRGAGQHQAIKRVVAEGVGLAVVSRLAVAAECAAGALAVLPVAGLRIERPLHLVRRRAEEKGSEQKKGEKKGIGSL